MYELMVEDGFSAAHKLMGYEGECSDLHGHNFRVQIFVEADNVNKIGLTIDFRKLKDRLKGILKELDHKYLNELPAFKDKNPTSENLARYIYEELSNQIEAILTKVMVWESETSYVGYRGNDKCRG